MKTTDMMNTIDTIIDGLSEDDLIEIVHNSETLRTEGVVGACKLRQVTEEISNATKSPSEMTPALMTISSSLAYRRLALKYIDLDTQVRSCVAAIS